MKIKKLSLLFIVPFCLFSCSTKNDYNLVTFDKTSKTYTPVIENCNYTYQELKENYFVKLPFLIPGDKIKISYKSNGTPKSFKVEQGKYKYAYRGIGMCSIDRNFYYKDKNDEEQYITDMFNWSRSDFEIQIIDEDLSIKTITTNAEIPNECYFTYNENIKNNNKYVVQSIWDKKSFKVYCLPN